MNAQDKDFDYFLANMKSLYSEHGHKFVSVKNQSILGVYDTFNDALEKTLKTEKLGTFLVQECFDNKEKWCNIFNATSWLFPYKAMFWAIKKHREIALPYHTTV